MARRVNCAEVLPLLSPYLDGEVSKGERTLVELHLKECPACREKLAWLSKVQETTHKLEAVEPPVSLRQMIMAKVEQARKCEEVQGLVPVYLDGEATPEEAQKVAEHLEVCRECREDLEKERTLQEILRSLPEVKEPAYLRARIYASIRRTSLVQRAFKWGFATFAAAAASLLFVLLPARHEVAPTPQTPVIAQSQPTSIPSLPVMAPSRESTKIALKPSSTTRLQEVVRRSHGKAIVAHPQDKVTLGESGMTTASTVPANGKGMEEVVALPKEEPVMIAEPQKPEVPKEIVETTPATVPPEIKVAEKPALSELLKDVTRSLPKPSLSSSRERLNKTLFVGVAKVEF